MARPITRYMLRENTTTTLKPDESINSGSAEVARIEAEMRAILDANGFAGRPIGESMEQLAKGSAFPFSERRQGPGGGAGRIHSPDRAGAWNVRSNCS